MSEDQNFVEVQVRLDSSRVAADATSAGKKAQQVLAGTVVPLAVTPVVNKALIAAQVNSVPATVKVNKIEMGEGVKVPHLNADIKLYGDKQTTLYKELSGYAARMEERLNNRTNVLRADVILPDSKDFDIPTLLSGLQSRLDSTPATLQFKSPTKAALNKIRSDIAAYFDSNPVNLKAQAQVTTKARASQPGVITSQTNLPDVQASAGNETGGEADLSQFRDLFKDGGIGQELPFKQIQEYGKQIREITGEPLKLNVKKDELLADIRAILDKSVVLDLDVNTAEAIAKIDNIKSVLQVDDSQLELIKSTLHHIRAELSLDDSKLVAAKAQEVELDTTQANAKLDELILSLGRIGESRVLLVSAPSIDAIDAQINQLAASLSALDGRVIDANLELDTQQLKKIVETNAKVGADLQVFTKDAVKQVAEFRPEVHSELKLNLESALSQIAELEKRELTLNATVKQVDPLAEMDGKGLRALAAEKGVDVGTKEGLDSIRKKLRASDTQSVEMTASLSTDSATKQFESFKAIKRSIEIALHLLTEQAEKELAAFKAVDRTVGASLTLDTTKAGADITALNGREVSANLSVDTTLAVGRVAAFNPEVESNLKLKLTHALEQIAELEKREVTLNATIKESDPYKDLNAEQLRSLASERGVDVSDKAKPATIKAKLSQADAKSIDVVTNLVTTQATKDFEAFKAVKRVIEATLELLTAKASTDVAALDGKIVNATLALDVAELAKITKDENRAKVPADLKVFTKLALESLATFRPEIDSDLKLDLTQALSQIAELEKREVNLSATISEKDPYKDLAGEDLKKLADERGVSKGGKLDDIRDRLKSQDKQISATITTDDSALNALKGKSVDVVANLVTTQASADFETYAKIARSVDAALMLLTAQAKEQFAAYKSEKREITADLVLTLANAKEQVKKLVLAKPKTELDLSVSEAQKKASAFTATAGELVISDQALAKFSATELPIPAKLEIGTEKALATIAQVRQYAETINSNLVLNNAQALAKIDEATQTALNIGLGEVGGVELSEKALADIAELERRVIDLKVDFILPRNDEIAKRLRATDLDSLNADQTKAAVEELGAKPARTKALNQELIKEKIKFPTPEIDNTRALAQIQVIDQALNDLARVRSIEISPESLAIARSAVNSLRDELSIINAELVVDDTAAAAKARQINAAKLNMTANVLVNKEDLGHALSLAQFLSEELEDISAAPYGVELKFLGREQIAQTLKAIATQEIELLTTQAAKTITSLNTQLKAAAKVSVELDASGAQSTLGGVSRDNIKLDIVEREGKTYEDLVASVRVKAGKEQNIDLPFSIQKKKALADIAETKSAVIDLKQAADAAGAIVDIATILTVTPQETVQILNNIEKALKDLHKVDSVKKTASINLGDMADKVGKIKAAEEALIQLEIASQNPIRVEGEIGDLEGLVSRLNDTKNAFYNLRDVMAQSVEPRILFEGLSLFNRAIVVLRESYQSLKTMLAQPLKINFEEQAKATQFVDKIKSIKNVTITAKGLEDLIKQIISLASALERLDGKQFNFSLSDGNGIDKLIDKMAATRMQLATLKGQQIDVQLVTNTSPAELAAYAKSIGQLRASIKNGDILQRIDVSKGAFDELTANYELSKTSIIQKSTALQQQLKDNLDEGVIDEKTASEEILKIKRQQNEELLILERSRVAEAKKLLDDQIISQKRYDTIVADSARKNAVLESKDFTAAKSQAKKREVKDSSSPIDSSVREAVANARTDAEALIAAKRMTAAEIAQIEQNLSERIEGIYRARLKMIGNVASKEADQIRAELASINKSNPLETVETGARKGQSAFSRLKDEIGQTITQMVLFGAGAAFLAALPAQVTKTAVEMERLQSALDFSQGGATGGAAAFEKVNATADRLGLRVGDLVKGYSDLTIASESLEGADGARYFDAVATSVAAFKLNTEQSAGVFKAFTDILSKGTLQAEELRGQLGDRMAGAFGRAAESLGYTTEELSAALKAGKVSAVEFADAFAKNAEQTMAFEAALNSNTITGKLAQLNNEFTRLSISAGESFLPILASGLDSVGQAMEFVSQNGSSLVSGMAGIAIAFASLTYGVKAAKIAYELLDIAVIKLGGSAELSAKQLETSGRIAATAANLMAGVVVAAASAVAVNVLTTAVENQKDKAVEANQVLEAYVDRLKEIRSLNAGGDGVGVSTDIEKLGSQVDKFVSDNTSAARPDPGSSISRTRAFAEGDKSVTREELEREAMMTATFFDQQGKAAAEAAIKVMDNQEAVRKAIAVQKQAISQQDLANLSHEQQVSLLNDTKAAMDRLPNPDPKLAAEKAALVKQLEAELGKRKEIAAVKAPDPREASAKRLLATYKSINESALEGVEAAEEIAKAQYDFNLTDKRETAKAEKDPQKRIMAEIEVEKVIAEERERLAKKAEADRLKAIETKKQKALAAISVEYKAQEALGRVYKSMGEEADRTVTKVGVLIESIKTIGDISIKAGERGVKSAERDQSLAEQLAPIEKKSKSLLAEQNEAFLSGDSAKGVEIGKQIEKEKESESRQLQHQKELKRQLGDRIRDEYGNTLKGVELEEQLMIKQQAEEDKLAAKKKAALMLELAVAEKTAQLEEARVKIAAKRQIVDLQLAKIQAQKNAQEAASELEKIDKSKDPEGFAKAQQNLIDANDTVGITDEAIGESKRLLEDTSLSDASAQLRKLKAAGAIDEFNASEKERVLDNRLERAKLGVDPNKFVDQQQQIKQLDGVKTDAASLNNQTNTLVQTINGAVSAILQKLTPSSQPKTESIQPVRSKFD